MITDSPLIRSIANQRSFSFDLIATFSNPTGECLIGFSGNENSYFKFESGKVYDFDNRYVYGYVQNTPIAISGNVVSGTYNYFINQRPICLLGQLNTGTYYSGFYINPSDVTVDFNLNLPQIGSCLSILQTLMIINSFRGIQDRS